MHKHKHYDLIVAWAAGAEIEYMEDGGNWHECQKPCWHLNVEYRIKPAAPKWPETTMTYEDMRKAYIDVAKKDCAQATWHGTAAKNIANDALRHACETGQLVLPDPERDMKIAKAAWIAGVNSESSNDLEEIIKEATK